MKLIYLKSALKFNSFDVAIGIKIPFFRVLVTIEPGRSLLQFVTAKLFDRNRTKISDKERVKERWVENFENQRNRDTVTGKDI